MSTLIMWALHAAETQISLCMHLFWSETLFCAYGYLRGVASCGHWRLWSGWAEAKADMNLHLTPIPNCFFFFWSHSSINISHQQTENLKNAFKDWYQSREQLTLSTWVLEIFHRFSNLQRGSNYSVQTLEKMYDFDSLKNYTFQTQRIFSIYLLEFRRFL